MKYAIAFSSPTGNTKMLADKIASILPESQCIYFGKLSPLALEADVIYLGFWTTLGSCDKATAEFIKQLTNQKVFLFGTAGYASDDYFEQITKNVISLLPEGVEVLANFICQGKMGMPVRKRYEKILEENPNDEKTKMLLTNFDKALTHPNENDLDNLAKIIDLNKIYNIINDLPIYK